jgi:hypothetical protein
LRAWLHEQTPLTRYTCEPCDAPSADPACVRITAIAAKEYAPHTTFGSVDELLALYRPALTAATNAADRSSSNTDESSAVGSGSSTAATGTAGATDDNNAAAEAAAEVAAAAAAAADDHHNRQLQAAPAVATAAPAAAVNDKAPAAASAMEVLDVMLLYTTALKNKLGDQGIKALLASSVAQSNLVYANCGIPLIVRVSILTRH